MKACERESSCPGLRGVHICKQAHATHTPAFVACMNHCSYRPPPTGWPWPAKQRAARCGRRRVTRGPRPTLKNELKSLRQPTTSSPPNHVMSA